MFRYNESLFLSIDFNGIDLPLTDNTIIETLLITTNVKMSLPSCSLVIRDKTGFFETRCSMVADLPFTIKIGTSPDSLQVFKFRVFAPSESKDSNETTYSLIGLYRAPKFILESRNSPLRGSSSAVLKTISEESGLAYDGVETTDLQVWHPGNNKNHVFVRQIVSHAYVDKSSCLRHGVTGTGEFRLRNLPAIDTKGAAVFWRGIQPEAANNSYQLYDLSASVNAGYSNVLSGYSQSLIQQSAIDVVTRSFKKIAVSSKNSSLSMNSTLSKGIELTRVTFAPMDCGNCHANYEQAAYQNTRIGHMYSSSITFMHGTKTELDLLDPVTILQQTYREAPEDSVSGNYIITGKALFLQGMNFYEKFEAVRMGNTVDMTNTQVNK